MTFFTAANTAFAPRFASGQSAAPGSSGSNFTFFNGNKPAQSQFEECQGTFKYSFKPTERSDTFNISKTAQLLSLVYMKEY